MDEKEEFCKTFEDCLTKWSRRIGELQSEIREAEDRDSNCTPQLKVLQQMEAQMRLKLEEIRNSDEWESLREDAEKIRTEMEENPISRFK